MTDGFYGIYYTGTAGSGFGLIVLMDGTICGADVAGGLYNGKYSIDTKTSTLDGDLQLKVPTGGQLVTGISISNEPLTLDIPLKLKTDFDSEKPILIQTSAGPVNVIFKRLRDLPVREKVR